MSNNEDFRIHVPMESFYEYLIKGPYKDYKQIIVSDVCNTGKKPNYKKFAKILKKASKYLPYDVKVTINYNRSVINNEQRDAD